MVVCKYFMDGGCKYGSRCRFEHIQSGRDYRYADSYNNNYSADRYSGGRSVLRSTYVKYNNNQAPVREDTGRQFGKENVNEIYQSVLKEITAAEKGQQWPLSCFGPIKGCPDLNMPGWEDHSPEEIRWELYKAYKNGTFAACKQALDALYNDAKEKRAKMKIRENAYSIIENLLEKENMNGVEMEQNLNMAPNINWNHQGVPVAGFGNNTVPAFAGSNTSFFGTATTTNTFPPALQQVSTFGIPQQANSTFGAVNPPQNHAFRFELDPIHPHPQASVFPQNQFGMQEKVVNIAPPPAPTTVATVRPDLQESTTFSTQSALSESDIKAFESNTFTFGSIPLKPPTKGLCRL